MFALSRYLASLRPLPTTSPLTIKRSFSALSSSLPTRPTLSPSPIRTSSPNTEVATTLLQPTPHPSLQIRGAKRDTFNPSHVVRKRRHGFLSRLRTRTGRKILKRRRAKGRNTLSH